MSLASQLGKLKELKDSGAITQQVFEQLRNRLLDECVRRIEALHDQKPLIRAAQELEPAPVIADAVPGATAAGRRVDAGAELSAAASAQDIGAAASSSQSEGEGNEGVGRTTVPFLGWELPPVKVVHGTVQHLRFLPAEEEKPLTAAVGAGQTVEIRVPSPLRSVADAGVEITTSTTLHPVAADPVESAAAKQPEAASSAPAQQSAAVTPVEINVAATQHARAVPRLDFGGSSSQSRAGARSETISATPALPGAVTPVEGSASLPRESSAVAGVGMGSASSTMPGVAASAEGGASLPRESSAVAGAGMGSSLSTMSRVAASAEGSALLPRESSAVAGAGMGSVLSTMSRVAASAEGGALLPRESSAVAGAGMGSSLSTMSRVAASAEGGALLPRESSAVAGVGMGSSLSTMPGVAASAEGSALLPRESRAVAGAGMGSASLTMPGVAASAQADQPKSALPDNCHLFESFYQRKPPVWARWGLPPVKVVRGVAQNVRFSNEDDEAYAASLEVDGQRVEIDSSSSIGIDAGDHLTLGGYEREGKLLALAYHNDSKGAHSDLRRLRRGYRFLFTIGWTSLLAGLGAVAGTVILLILRQRMGAFDSGFWGFVPYALSGLAAVAVSYFGFGLSFLGARAKEFHDAMNPSRAWQK